MYIGTPWLIIHDFTLEEDVPINPLLFANIIYIIIQDNKQDSKQVGGEKWADINHHFI